MLKKIVNDYSESLQALRGFADLIGPFLRRQLTEVTENNFPYIEKILRYYKEVSSTSETNSVEEALSQMSEHNGISNEFIAEAKLTIKELVRSSRQIEILYQSSLMNLINTTEWLIYQVIHNYFDKYPDALENKSKCFSLDELRSFDCIKDAEKHLISTRVEEIMRGSFEDWIDFFKNVPKLSMGYLKIDDIIEVFQRRNIIVHNGGIVNSIYLSKVKTNLKKGEKVHVIPMYINKAINIFELNFILIAAELWKKLEPKNDKRSDILIDIALEHLKMERWDIAEGLSYFVMNDKQLPESSQLVGKINYWQSLKWSGNIKKLESEIENVDLSAKKPKFQLALYALKNDNDQFFELLPGLLKSEELSKDDLQSWPLFREIRQDERMKKFE